MFVALAHACATNLVVAADLDSLFVAGASEFLFAVVRLASVRLAFVGRLERESVQGARCERARGAGHISRPLAFSARASAPRMRSCLTCGDACLIGSSASDASP